MKKRIIVIFISILSVCCSIKSGAQTAAVSSLSENFDVACVTSPYFGHNWLHYNPVAGTDPSGAWKCSATDGNHSTPGMECTSYFSGINHLDTSYLITPLLNLSSYTGHNIYLHFDSKTTEIYSGGKLGIYEADYPDSNFHTLSIDSALTGTAYPDIGEPGDSTGWVTHEVDITTFESVGNFYLAFRYVSSAVTGSIWYIDNVNISTFSIRLNIPQQALLQLPLTVLGTSTRDEITISYYTAVPGQYNLSVYDMMGRKVYAESLNAGIGNETYTLKGLNLQSGMYCIKIDNVMTYGVAKTMIR